MKQVTTGVGFQDPLGNLLANGVLILDLSQNAEVTSGGGQIIPKRITFPLDANGKITATNIWFNDELTPSGTTYTAKVFDSSGLTGYSLGNWSITGASADLSTMTTTNTGASYPAPVLLVPAGNQTITTGNLALSAGDFQLASGHLLSWNSDTGLSRDSAGVIDVGNGTAGDKSGTLQASKHIGSSTSGQSNAAIQASGAGTVGFAWNNTSGAADQKWADATLSTSVFLLRFVNDANNAASTIMQSTRGAGVTTGTITFGGGGNTQTLFTSADTIVGRATTDTLTNKGFADKVTLYNNISTVGNGLASTYAQSDQTAQNGSIGSSNLITGGATTGGHYVIYFALYCTTSDASGASVVINITFTSEGIIRNSSSSSVAFASTANATQAAFPLNADNSTNIAWSTTVTGVPTTGKYAAHIWIVKM